MPDANLITRRQFLNRSAAMGGVFMITKPTTAFGSQANSRINVGMIGLGGRGWLISTMLKEHPGYELVAGCDYFKQVVDVQGEKLGIPVKSRFSTLSGYQGLIDSDLDAVFLETPPYAFPDHVAYAIDKGKHIYMAKPVACDVPGCLRVKEAADKAKIREQVFLVDYQMPTDPHILEVVKRITRGDIGNLKLLVTHCGSSGFADPPLTNTIESRLQQLIWVNDTALGCGYLGNYDIHALDVALWMAGENPEAAMGSSRMRRDDPHGDSHDVYSVTYEFPSGLLLNHYSEHFPDTNLRLDCFAHGASGLAETAYWGDARINSESRPYEGGHPGDLYSLGIKRNLDAFQQAILGGDYSNSTVKRSVDSALMCILGRDAAERRSTLRWGEMLLENRVREVDLTGLAQ